MTPPGQTSFSLSVVLSFRNENDVIPELVRRLKAVLEPITPRFEILFVNEDSTDGSLTGSEPAVWSIVVCALLIISGLQTAMLGLMALYVGRILNEVTDRPRYIIESMIGFDAR